MSESRSSTTAIIGSAECIGGKGAVKIGYCSSKADVTGWSRRNVVDAESSDEEVDLRLLDFFLLDELEAIEETEDMEVEDADDSAPLSSSRREGFLDFSFFLSFDDLDDRREVTLSSAELSAASSLLFLLLSVPLLRCSFAMLLPLSSPGAVVKNHNSILVLEILSSGRHELLSRTAANARKTLWLVSAKFWWL